MNLYGFALFLHLLVLGGIFAIMGIVEFNFGRMRSPATLDDLRVAAAKAERTAKLFPILFVLLLATGAWLTGLQWPWSTPWVDVAIVGLVLIMGIGGGVLAPRMAKAGAAARAANAMIDVPADLTGNAALRYGTAANYGLVIAVMFVMVMKPDMTWGLLALAVGLLAGVGIRKATER